MSFEPVCRPAWTREWGFHGQRSRLGDELQEFSRWLRYGREGHSSSLSVCGESPEIPFRARCCQSDRQQAGRRACPRECRTRPNGWLGPVPWPENTPKGSRWGGPPPGRAEPLRLSHPVSGSASGSVREPKRGVNGEPVLGRRFRTHHHERAGGGAPGASDRSFVDQCHRTSARTAVRDDEHLVLVALRSAGGGLAVGARNADGAVTWR